MFGIQKENNSTYVNNTLYALYNFAISTVTTKKSTRVCMRFGSNINIGTLTNIDVQCLYIYEIHTDI